MTDDPTGDERLVATLRDGSEHLVSLNSEADAAHVFDEVTAGRSQLLRGWVAVVPTDDATRAVVSGDEIIALRLVRPGSSESV